MNLIRNVEQFKQYFYLYLLGDVFDEDFYIGYIESYLKDYLLYYGYLGYHDIDDILKLYYEKGRI